jgi:Leucine-rich repeat (LRR) protein
MVIIVKYIDDSIKKFNDFKYIFDDKQVNIIYLDCSENQLKEIPKEIGNLINLQKFNCFHNQLNELPKEIGNLINLQYFYCYDNQLKDLPIEIINCRNLRYFNYHNNEIIMNPIIQRFINRMNNIKNHNLYNDGQNVHTSSVQQSIKESIINLLKDTY